MQRPSNPIQRARLLALCLAFTAALIAPVSAGAQRTTVATAIKHCRQRYAGKGKGSRRAERQCVKKAKAKQPSKPAPVTASTPAALPPAATDTPAAPTQLPAPDPTGETTPPPGPSMPTPPPLLELGLPHTSVMAGSSVGFPLPEPLVFVNTIESVTGREPGVGAVLLSGGGIRIEAAFGATPVTRTWTISGTGCTASECERKFAIHLRVAVEESPAPSVQVIANGPVSGPAGFGTQVLTSSCSRLEVGFDDGSWYDLIPSEPKEAFSVNTPSTLSTGPHQVSLNCLTTRSSAPIWTASGFEVSVNGAGIPLSLERTTVSAGDELMFTSGPSLAATQCPTLPGLSVSELNLELNTGEGSIVITRHIPMPDGQATEGLSVPASAAAGLYSVFDRCSYTNVAGEHASYEFAAPRRSVTVN